MYKIEFGLTVLDTNSFQQFEFPASIAGPVVWIITGAKCSQNPSRIGY